MTQGLASVPTNNAWLAAGDKTSFLRENRSTSYRVDKALDFQLVFGELLPKLEREGIRYALIGGFALGLWGVPRGTADIDLLVQREDLARFDGVMEALGYECRHRTENVSQFVAPAKALGEIDLLHAFRRASLGMLERARKVSIFEGAQEVRVLIPEDIVGLKLQAIKNNPARSATDMADVEQLLALHKETVNWELVEEYFELFEMTAELERLNEDLKRNA